MFLARAALPLKIAVRARSADGEYFALEIQPLPDPAGAGA